VPAAAKSLIDTQGVRILNDSGAPYIDIWLAKGIAADVKPAEADVLYPGMPDGTLLGWTHRIVGPTVASQKDPRNPDRAGEYGFGGARVPYASANVLTDYVAADPGVPLGWWRSVEASCATFAIESFVDELALAARQDPVAFRLRLLQQDPGLQGVLRLAAQRARWGSAVPARHGRGVAVYVKGSTRIAQVAEVAVAADGSVRVPRVFCAVDCGFAVNPDQVAAQIEGGIVFGASAALLGEITLASGRVSQGNWHDYPMLAMDEAPVVDVQIVPSDEPPSGVGEAPVPPIAPAIANAVFAATGRRVRTLPIGRTSPRAS
jgi:isoquinoline 1-oxidoreductase beta subunit